MKTARNYERLYDRRYCIDVDLDVDVGSRTFKFSNLCWCCVACIVTYRCPCMLCQTQTILVVVYWSLHRRKEQLRLPVANRRAIVVKQEALYQVWICLSVSSVRKEPEKKQTQAWGADSLHLGVRAVYPGQCGSYSTRPASTAWGWACRPSRQGRAVSLLLLQKNHVPQAAELACKKAAGRRKLHSTECL